MRSRRSDGPAAHELAGRFARALRAGSPLEAGVVAADALDAGLTVPAVQSQVITPAMRTIGDLWQCGELTVGDEHLATAITQEVLGRLFPRALKSAPRSRERVMVAAVEGEHHDVGLRMVADVLEGAGFDVLYLGPDVPVRALLESCRTHKPALLGLTVSMPENLPMFVWEVQEVRALNQPPIVFAGGAAVAEALEQGLEIPSVGDSEHVLATVEGLLAAPLPMATATLTPASQPPSGAPEGSPDFDEAEGIAGAFSQTALSGAEATRDSARHAYAMELLAFRDPLTGLWNRRAFDDRYVELTGDAGFESMVLTIDVDHFKVVNDTYGHTAGDAVLVGVANAMRRAIRPGDFVARYGGDEFAVLLPRARLEEAAAIGERIRKGVEAELVDPPVTVSVGVGQADPNARRTALAVDRALYDAKETGRNQVVVSAA